MVERDSSPPRIVVIGAGGRLGAALVREYSREHRVVGFNHAQLDIGDAGQLHARLDAIEFEVPYNCVAPTCVDHCKTECDEAFTLNAAAPRVLAEIANEKARKADPHQHGFMFSIVRQTPYREEDEGRPAQCLRGVEASGRT